MTIGMTIYVVSVYQNTSWSWNDTSKEKFFQWIPEEVPVADIVQVPLQMEAIPGIGETGVTGAVTAIPIYLPLECDRSILNLRFNSRT